MTDLKANGEQIRVDFASCEIIDNNYTEQVQSYGDDSLLLSTTAPRLHHLLNALEEVDRSGNVDVSVSVILFRYPNNRTGITETFTSHNIAKDRITLSFYLDRQKQTTLYVSRSDRSLYYFDLAFLKT